MSKKAAMSNGLRATHTSIEQSVPVADAGLWLLRVGVCAAGLITPLDVPRHIGIRVAPSRSLV
jgi:hypothetical protein